MSDGEPSQQVARAQDRLDRLRDLFNLAHLIVDFVAGTTFVVGSWLLFYPAWDTTATWLFLVGSIAFAAKPTIRLYHAVQDRRTRQRLEDELSAEAVEQLRRLRPARPLRPLS